MFESRQAEQAFWRKYLAPIKGGTIIGIGTITDGEFIFPAITVKTKDGEVMRLEISQDEEGNGPGFIFGLPFPMESHLI